MKIHEQPNCYSLILALGGLDNGVHYSSTQADLLANLAKSVDKGLFEGGTL